MKAIKIYALLSTLVFLNVSAQDFSVNKIEPPNWWADMKLNSIQLMIYGNNLNGVEAKFTSNKISVVDQHFVENNSYIFIDIELDESLQPGDYELVLKKAAINRCMIILLCRGVMIRMNITDSVITMQFTCLCRTGSLTGIRKTILWKAMLTVCRTRELNPAMAAIFRV